MRALLFLGADVSVKDNYGKTALQYVEEDSNNYHDILDVFAMFTYGMQ